MNQRSDPITVGPVVLAYVDSQNTSLFTPHKNSGGKDNYGCTIIFNQDVHDQIKALVDQVGAAAFPNEWNNPQSNLHRAIHPAAAKPQFQGYGQYYASVATGFPPTIVDFQQQPIINALDPMTGQKPIYDGVYVYVSVSAYSFSNIQRGVALGLGPIMKYMDGQPMNLGSGVSVEQAFANVPQPPPGAQPPQAQPPQGQPPQGQPPQGQPPQGQPVQGQPVQGQPVQGYPPQGQPAQGYPPQGQPAQGQPAQGYPPQGQPAQGQPPDAQPPQGGQPAPQWPQPGMPPGVPPYQP
jgi:hypothetical protein